MNKKKERNEKNKVLEKKEAESKDTDTAKEPDVTSQSIFKSLLSARWLRSDKSALWSGEIS